MNTISIKIGDFVLLKSGSPIMLVTHIQTPNEKIVDGKYGWITTTWIDHTGTQQKSSFYPQQLIYVGSTAQ